jgi:hypothetical protein
VCVCALALVYTHDVCVAAPCSILCHRTSLCITELDMVTVLERSGGTKVEREDK